MAKVGMVETAVAKSVERIKALSIKQPWASMIARGSKTIETRTWPTSLRGRLLIVSSKKPEIDGLPVGQALCTCELVDCRRMTERDEPDAQREVYSGAWSWFLTNIQPISPFAVRGQQGLYWVDLQRDRGDG